MKKLLALNTSATLLAALLSGCGALRGPLAELSTTLSTANGELTVSEVRHKPNLADSYLECRQTGDDSKCRERTRTALTFSCTEVMDPRVYVVCLRCVAKSNPDESECARLAAHVVSGSAEINASARFTLSGHPFIGNGTADPPNHPEVGPIPPLTQ